MSDRVEALFHQASDLPPDERRALLDAACRDDPGLRAEVERLLAEDARLHAEAGAGAFLDSPLVRSPDADVAREVEGGWGPEPTRPDGPTGPPGPRPAGVSPTIVSSACSARGAWAPSTRRSRTTRAAPSR